MFARVISATLRGVDAIQVDAEVDVSAGSLPSYKVVGLPATSVKEGALRIRSALGHVGQRLPARRITINLAPANERKNGAAFDLPIAVAILTADQSNRLRWPDDLMIMGELGLDGSVRSVPGGLAAALLARRLGLRGLVLPEETAREAAAVGNISIHAASHLGQVVDFLAGRESLPPVRAPRRRARPPSSVDMSDVRGQPLARAGIEIAVAGGHNVLLVGPPGAGKTMLARRVPTILPPLTRDEAIETTKVQSAAGRSNGQIARDRPFRAPHHTASGAALVGGGSNPRPGEISLAHNGVLFLDELPEFSRTNLEMLRQPLESRIISIARANATLSFPASFLLVAAANPCPCGWYGSPRRACVCSARLLSRYRTRLSGPLLDRFDLQLRVRSVPLAELRSMEPGESSRDIQQRVLGARARQHRRYRRLSIKTNAEMTAPMVFEICRVDQRGERILQRLQEVRGFTARGVHRVLKVARTIADLAARDAIGVDHLIDAANLRALDSDPPIPDLRAQPRLPGPAL